MFRRQRIQELSPIRLRLPGKVGEKRSLHRDQQPAGAQARSCFLETAPVSGPSEGNAAITSARYASGCSPGSFKWTPSPYIWPTGLPDRDRSWSRAVFPSWGCTGHLCRFPGVRGPDEADGKFPAHLGGKAAHAVDDVPGQIDHIPVQHCGSGPAGGDRSFGVR